MTPAHQPGRQIGPPQILWHSARLQIESRFAPPADPGGPCDLVLAFASVGRDPTRLPEPEFIATALGRGLAPGPEGRRGRLALFIRDGARLWGNDPDLGPALHEAIAKACQAHRLAQGLARRVALGQSMGGYAALVAGRLLDLDLVLAFGPQFSPCPGVIAGEDRWADWTARLPADLAFPQAPLPQPGRGWAVLCHGAGDDLAQALAFAPSRACALAFAPSRARALPNDLAPEGEPYAAPKVAGVDTLLFAGQDHAGLVPHLKARGALAGLLAAGLAGDRRRLLRIAASCGGRLRPQDRDGAFGENRG